MNLLFNDHVWLIGNKLFKVYTAGQIGSPKFSLDMQTLKTKEDIESINANIKN